MFAFIHDISAWLEAILTAISSNFWLSLLFIFLVCIGEAVFIVGLLVPSLPILLLTGGLIAHYRDRGNVKVGLWKLGGASQAG